MSAWSDLLDRASAPSGWARGIAAYSLRPELERDLAGSLERLKSLGFANFEGRGCGEAQASRLREALDRVGLKCAGVVLEPQPTPIEQLRGAVVLGARFASVPAAPPYFRMEGGRYTWRESVSTAELLAFVKSLAPLAEAFQRAGVELLYHLHDRDYAVLDSGLTMLDLLLGALPAGALGFEVDTGWLAKARVDLPTVYAKLSGRVRSIHLKDFDPARAAQPLGFDLPAPGEGTVDLVPMLTALRAAGAHHAFVELEPYGEAWARIERSAAWLTAHGY